MQLPGETPFARVRLSLAVLMCALTLAWSTAQADAPTSDGAIAFERNLAKAFVNNDPSALGSLLADDWVVVSARGQIADRGGVIDAVRKGLWVHKGLDISETRVRIYGNTGVVTYRLANAGILGGKPFNVLERETDVLLWSGNAWKAVLSHESFLNE